MKKSIGYKIRLGIFITVGIVIFITAIYFIGEKQQLFRSTFRLSGEFKDVAGLQVGNNVRLSGINVGIIENITIVSDSSVRVAFLVDESTREFIKKDAVATIGSEGLMGNKILIIIPGTGGEKRIEDNDAIKTSPPINMDDILNSLQSTIDHTSNITSDLAVITNNIQSGKGTIGRLIMDKGWRENFDSTFANLKDGSDGFKMIMQKEGELDSIIASIRVTIDNTSKITNDLADITKNIQMGKGTIGRMLMDQSAAENLDSTFLNLKLGSEGFKLLMEKAKDSWLLWGF
jgi:phospholipid/cholesterol/gamma-HCH transport system substrate-binding protein